MTGVEEGQGAELAGQGTTEEESTQTEAEFWRSPEVSLASVLDLQRVRGNDPKRGKDHQKGVGKTISRARIKIRTCVPTSPS